MTLYLVINMDQFLRMDIFTHKYATMCFCSFIYAKYFRSIRRDIWNYLKSGSFGSQPWVDMGDFNAICWWERRGNASQLNGPCTEFGDWIYENDLKDAG